MQEEEGHLLVLCERGSFGIVNERHYFKCMLNIYHQAEADMEWTPERLWMLVNQRHDGAVHIPRQSIRFSRTANGIVVIFI